MRSLIDGFYNFTSLLDDPGRADLFRTSGYRRMLDALDYDEKRYGGITQWDDYIREARKNYATQIERDGFDVAAVRLSDDWPLLGNYLRNNKRSEHAKMLRRLTFGFWQEYSSISHVTFQGMMNISMFLSRDRAPHDVRDQIFDLGERNMTTHIGRASGVMLCAVTETQAYYQFVGHHVDQRIHEVWRAMNVMPEVKELYDFRYRELMENRGIKDVPSEPSDIS